MKAIAAGENAAGEFNVHHAATFERLLRDPRGWLRSAQEKQGSALTDEPAPYRGGPLRHTAAPDELARLLALFAAQGEVLARSHGQILDRKRLIRREMLQDAARARRLF